jgi:hypothetical protein
MGLVATLLGLGTLGLAGHHAARRVFRFQAGPPAILGGIVLAWTWLTLGTLGLGLAGWLTSPALLAWSAAGLLISAVVSRRAVQTSPVPVVKDPEEGLGLAALLALGFTLWAMVVLLAPSLFFPVKVVTDAPIYHLYFAARWWQAGRIFLIATPFGESAAPYFPAVGDLWLTWLFVLGGGDRLARVGQTPFVFVAVSTAYVIARRLGAKRPAALIASCWFATVLPYQSYPFEANVDWIFVAGYLLAVYFGLRYAIGDDGVGSLILGALAAGAAWGTKAPGVIFVPPLLLFGVGTALARAGSWRTRLRDAAVIVFVPLVLEGYWLGRNAWLTGNPLYPLHLHAFGRTWLAGWFGPEAMQLSQYYIPREDWRSAIDVLFSFFDPRLTLVWLLALLGGWQFGRSRRAEDAAVWCLAFLAVLNVLLFWVVIPYRTQPRFLLPAAGVAVVPLARLFDRNRFWLWLGSILLIAHVVTQQSFPFTNQDGTSPWDFSPIVPSNAPGPVLLQTHLGYLLHPIPGDNSFFLVCRIVVGLLCLGVAATVAWARRGRWWRSIVPVIALGLLVWTEALLVAPAKRAEILYSFPAFPDYLSGWSDLDRRTRTAGARIAYAGTNIPHYLMGNDFRNEVRYVNVDSHRGWLLHDYHRAAAGLGLPDPWPDTRPGWDRLRPDYKAWLENLRADGIQLLVVARVNPQEGPHNVADAQGFPIERVWADAHHEVFVPLYSDPLFKTYALRKLEKKS